MENYKLKKLEHFSGREGPLVLIIMDGIGIAEKKDTNAFYLANTPFLDKLQSEKKLYLEIKAHGTAVGLPTDNEMGNSEVGHNAFGAGKIPKQRATLAKEAIESKSLFDSDKWKTFSNIINQNNKKVHLIGLLSDGYVHSHISHLIGILYGAKDSGIKKIRIHTLLDGRDVPPKSALEYINKLENELTKINKSGDFDYRIASGGGRMRVTMDRYNSDWNVVKRGWDAHVCAIPDQFLGYNGFFSSAKEAIEKARTLDPDLTDQYLPSFVIIDENNIPLGKMEDGDGVIYFNYRGDRAIQISRAFDEGTEFKDFEKKCNPNVIYYGLLQYDEKEHIPKRFFIDPPKIDVTFIDFLSTEKIPMFATSETFKIGHLCYFFWGNRDLITKTDYIKKENYDIRVSKSSFNEDIIEIVSFKSELIEKNPKMKVLEIKNELLDAIRSNKYKFLRVNLTNGDMVGHTGNIASAMVAAETVDTCVREIVDLVNKINGIVIVTADHGNLEDMSKEWQTSHTCNPVMFNIIDSQYNNEYTINNEIKEPSLGNVAGTIINLLGYENPNNFMESLIKFKK
ncbi:MAG: phosphoglycerate mutase (2,3-diphosphoglycerate-independent) [Candidatus Lokiarchaeota archaeon]|nr:phosphoglycerate mutase (2,3-diphosphoglycerate-independent) [Candidatus Lokiarchaeota archaeon]